MTLFLLQNHDDDGQRQRRQRQRHWAHTRNWHTTYLTALEAYRNAKMDSPSMESTSTATSPTLSNFSDSGAEHLNLKGEDVQEAFIENKDRYVPSSPWKSPNEP